MHWILYCIKGVLIARFFPSGSPLVNQYPYRLIMNVLIVNFNIVILTATIVIVSGWLREINLES